jgi:hypothetical protein
MQDTIPRDSLIVLASPQGYLGREGKHLTYCTTKYIWRACVFARREDAMEWGKRAGQVFGFGFRIEVQPITRLKPPRGVVD